MSLLFSIFLGIKGLAIIVGTMISTGGSGAVALQISSVTLRADTAFVEVRVSGVYSGELNDFLESGTPIPLILEAQLASDGGTLSRKTYVNYLKYDLASKHYIVIKSGDTVNVKDRETAKDDFPHFYTPLFSVQELDEGTYYRIKINCRLGKVKLDIMDKMEFDLMSLWKFKKPGLETRKFRKRDLQGD